MAHPDAETNQELFSKLDLHESAMAINRGLQDLTEGRVKTLAEFDHRMRSKILASIEKAAADQ